jgi:hypothetical protein
MKTYTAGRYQIQWRGRGPVMVDLTKAQAKALFEIHDKIPHEFISLQFESENI